MERKLQTLDFPVPVAPTTVMRGSMMVVDRGRARRNTLRKKLNMPEKRFSIVAIPWFVALFERAAQNGLKGTVSLHPSSRLEGALAVERIIILNMS